MMSKACIDCGSLSNGAIMVGQIETGSGGAILYACITHARRRAQRLDAPDWLAGDIAKFEAQEAAR
ncbi:hypothetical protein DB35_24915 [Streptomyces abyssalis]|uniref:Uncharacterized protein n=1 Tax=Streptomyces abyssalis TaxID=933944 RepID=A0A1E7JNA9_9ACTN|nr:hypothetical protein [Streptomyces abyssalis]OEU86849.1 hypothetical protein DB35_24915 [Streptomyces abyssalis]OEU89767.1 hypothetical protein AN215_08650 [Streptomyces abyssalis]